jgi:hypothetical protein
MDRKGFRTDAEIERGTKDEETIALIVSRQQAFVRGGWRYRRWLPTSPGSPGVVYDRSERTNYYYRDFDPVMLPRLTIMDHEYRLISPEAVADRTGGQTIWVTEPYMTRCREGEFNLLKAHLGTHWHARWFPEAAIWNPGATVAIWIARATTPLEAPWESRTRWGYPRSGSIPLERLEDPLHVTAGTVHGKGSSTHASGSR